jgi:hypothetical protein
MLHRMITALIRVEHGPGALAVTLAALVPGVVEGLVGDAVVLAADSDPAVTRVADALGAAVVLTGRDADPWMRGAVAGKRDWLLCLDDGDVPAEDWIRALERFVRLTAAERRFGRIPRRAAGWREVLASRWVGMVRSRPVRSGDLVHRSVLEGGRPKRAPLRIPALIERDPVFR